MFNMWFKFGMNNPWDVRNAATTSNLDFQELKMAAGVFTSLESCKEV